VTIADKHVVSIHYTLTDDDGETLDSSAGRDPLMYLHGASNIIPGLESALTGKDVGDKVQVTVEPADAYGEVDAELVQRVPREAFEGIEQIEPGMQFEARSPEGGSQVVVVKEVADDGVVIDGNHPLAGQTLHFDVSVEEVRAATDEEVAHGHVHGPGHSHS
jgi:FKBP-type peptidyl-prolyl cis-trans isomerase SlyD